MRTGRCDFSGDVQQTLPTWIRNDAEKIFLNTEPDSPRAVPVCLALHQPFNERIPDQRAADPGRALVALVEQVKPAADAMEDVPTEFEIITALGMLYFAQQQCDIVVLEVGLGGTLDSTNVIRKACLRGDHCTGHGPRQEAAPWRISPLPKPASSSRAARW